MFAGQDLNHFQQIERILTSREIVIACFAVNPREPTCLCARLVSDSFS
jgi:hypothetical protein